MLSFFALLCWMVVCATGQDLSVTAPLVNARRAQQGASNMNKLAYDKANEPLATKWIATCKEKKPTDNSLANYDAAYFYVSMFALANIQNALNDVLTLAYVENKAAYTLSSNTCAAGKDLDCRRYKTMSYGGYKTYGCAIAMGTCPSMTRLDNTVVSGKIPLLCVFQPKMPDPGMAPFIPGPPCSRCTPGFAKCETPFCTLGEGPTTTTTTTTTTSTTTTPTTTPATTPTTTPTRTPTTTTTATPTAALTQATTGSDGNTTAPSPTGSPRAATAITKSNLIDNTAPTSPANGDSAGRGGHLSALLLLLTAALQSCVLQPC